MNRPVHKADSVSRIRPADSVHVCEKGLAPRARGVVVDLTVRALARCANENVVIDAVVAADLVSIQHTFSDGGANAACRAGNENAHG